MGITSQKELLSYIEGNFINSENGVLTRVITENDLFRVVT